MAGSCRSGATTSGGAAGLAGLDMGIGCNKWGTKAGKFDGDALEATYVTALDLGVRLFNTAQVYPTSEACIGDLRSRTGRRESFVVSKFNSLGKAPAQLVESLRASLRDLRMAKVDGFLVHFPKGDLRALAAALAEAVDAGLVDHVGCSNFGETALRELHGLLKARNVPLAFNEIEFSLLRRRPETDGLLACCAELSVTVLAWAPLASGRLAGGHRADVTNPRSAPVLRALDVVSEKCGRTPAQVAINWCICKGVVPIPGARTKAQAEELCGAKNFRLSRTEVVALDSCALDSAGFYDDPEALLCFLGIKPPRSLRPLVVAFLKCALRLATALTPLQRDLR